MVDRSQSDPLWRELFEHGGNIMSQSLLNEYQPIHDKKGSRSYPLPTSLFSEELHAACQSLLKKIKMAITVTTHKMEMATDDEFDHIEIQDYTRTMVQIVRAEQEAWSKGCAVAYHTTKNKMLQYEIKSLLMQHVYGYDRNFALVASFDPNAYKHNIMDIVNTPSTRFDDVPIFTDKRADAQRTMSSMNLSLFPSGYSDDDIYDNFHAAIEALPHQFPDDGYDDLNDDESSRIIQEILCNVLGIQEKESTQVTQQLCATWKIATHNVTSGFCIQVAVPHKHVNRFMYVCTEWGYPINIYMKRVEEKQREIFYLKAYDPKKKSSKREPPEANEGQILSALEFICDTNAGKKLQARLMASPDLYLKYGAMAQVFSADPRYDRVHIHAALFEILEAYIARVGTK